MNPNEMDFLIAGFSKCGSTTLHQLVSDHPDIFVPGLKDQGFVRERAVDRMRSEFQILYSERRRERVCGYSNVFLSGVPPYGAVDFAAEHFPDAKVILGVRDPFDRIESSYREFHNSGADYGIDCPFGIGAALSAIPQILADTAYWSQIQDWRTHFGDEALMIVFLEDLKADAAGVMERCFSFLGVNPAFRLSRLDRRSNSSRQKYYDSADLRKMRNTIVHPETGIPLSRLGTAVQDQFLPQLGLRHSFAGTRVEWSERDTALVVDTLGDDVQAFFEWCGRSPSVWPRFSRAMEARTA